MKRYGYCCINLTLSDVKKDKVTTNRSMTKKTFLDKGINYASELALLNCKDLLKVIKWNNSNGIKMYRLSSDIFPWCSEYEFSDLKDFDEIKKSLKEAGDEAKRGDQRITFHPSPYGVLASLNPNVVKNAIKDLRQHSEIMDLMGLEQSYFYPINIHVNTAQPTREESAQRFCDNFKLLPDGVKKRLVVEIDDKRSQFKSEDLYELVYKKTGIPITFDFLHNKCNPSVHSEEEALKLCLSTWPEDIEPIVHYSDSRKIFENNEAKENAHSDWIWSKIETYGLNFSVELEVKMKEKALIKYLSDEKFRNHLKFY